MSRVQKVGESRKMVTHRWKYIGETDKAKIFVDYRASTTKIETFKYTYFHKGIYPFHNPDYTKKYRKPKLPIYFKIIMTST